METQENIGDVDVHETFVVKTDAGELCRLCANTDNQFIPIFQGEGLEHNLSLKIERHLPIIKVTEADKLPLQICYQCASTLISWHNLYEGCRVADKRLRELIAVDDKLYQEDDSCGDFADDFRDDYDDDTPVNLPTETPTTSNLESITFKDNSTKIPTLSETKLSNNETELDESDERYAKSTLPPLQLPSSSPQQPSLPQSSPLPSASPSQLSSSSSSPTRQIELDGGGSHQKSGMSLLEKALIRSDLDEESCKRASLKCNFCPMVFVKKAHIAHHLRSSHSSVAFDRVDDNDDDGGGDDGGGQSSSAKVAKKRTRSLPMTDSKTTKNWQTPVKKAKIDRNKNESDSNKAVKKTFPCNICSKVCLSGAGLKKHIGMHENGGNGTSMAKVRCEYCQLMFSSAKDKQDHVSSYHRIDVPSSGNDKKHVTDERDASNDASNLARNILLGDLMAKGDDEKENYSNGGDGDGDDDYEDDLDDEEAAKKKSKSSRQGTKKPFECVECDRTFETKSGFGRHMNSSHTAQQLAEGGYGCEVCLKRFSTQKSLKRHKGNVHRAKRVRPTGEEDPFSKWYVFADGQKHLKCDQCKYNSLWYHKGRFLEHYRIHTGEKPFTCDACGKQFRTKTLLQKHVLFVHEGVKDHPCDICGRCFSDKRYMEDHRRIHTGERPYVCDLCGKTFKQSASLFIHKELHKGLRKHVCEMCDKRFTTRSSLTIHIKRHIGERNFICATCGKAFVDGKHLKDHMAVHSNERPFSCELCGGKFKLMKHLKQHGRTHKRDYVA